MKVGLITECAYPASLEGPKSPRELLAGEWWKVGGGSGWRKWAVAVRGERWR